MKIIKVSAGSLENSGLLLRQTTDGRLHRCLEWL